MAQRLGGDFNCTQYDFLDHNHAEPNPASQHSLKQLLYSLGLVDVWRRIHTGCRQHTWSHLKENSISLSRLDLFFFFCFKYHFNVFKGFKMIPAVFTDHSLVLGDEFSF